MSYFNTIGPILQNGESKEEALDFLHGYDFSEDEVEPQEIGYAQYVDSYQGIDMFYDYGADYYFFAVDDNNVQENKVSNNMNKNAVRITEADLHQIIKDSVEQIIKENQEDEGFWQSMMNGASAMRDGWNSFKTRELADNDSYQPNKTDLKDVDNFMTQLEAQEQKLQIELNRVRNQRKALMKQYGLSQNGKGYGNGYSYKGQVPGGSGSQRGFRKSSLGRNGGLMGQANMNKG